ncbi:hypothetical protein D9M69_553030 [compost metagenome]
MIGLVLADDGDGTVKLALQALRVEVVIQEDHIDTFTLKRVAALVDHHRVVIFDQANH